MVFEKIREIIIEQLQVDESEVTMDTNLMKDLSADSLDAVEIIMAIEDEYGIEIPDEEAEEVPDCKGSCQICGRIQVELELK